jgi:hypothetical protein
MLFPVLLLAAAGLSLAQSEVLTNQQVVDRVTAQLIPKLSGGSFISFTAPPRWSTYDPPDPAVVVNVNNELDVSLTVGMNSLTPARAIRKTDC